MIPLLRQFLYAFLPGACILCDAPGQKDIDLCPDCNADLPRIKNCCSHCAIPLPEGDSICGKCLTQSPPFDHCHAAFIYEFPVDRLILDFKENRKLVTGKILAVLLARSFARDFTPPDLLLPVPLHKSSLRERGFNQSIEIADVLADHWSIPVDTRNCRRTHRTADQKSLHLEDRIKNMRGAFTIDKTYTGQRIAIVDDIVTTGSTVSALARLLLENGAGSVEVICLARTPA